MTIAERQKIVFDCNTFAQALISPSGPAATCFTHVQRGTLLLFVSDYVLREVRELPSKIKPKYGVDDAKIELLIRDLEKYAYFVKDVPSVYVHPVDPDDSHYVDLAVATNATLIVSRDRHLLNLMDAERPEAKEFKRLFPTLSVLTPDVFANQIRAEEQKQRT